jgi:hypothetical protein
MHCYIALYKHLTNLGQMLVSIHRATRVIGVNNHYCNSILICKSFDSFQVNLPTSLWNKIIMSYFHLMKHCVRFVFWITRPWEQYIDTGLAKNRHHHLDCLGTSRSKENIIRGKLVREITR